MGNKILLLALLITSTSIFSQINFENEKVLIDKYQMPSQNSEVLATDLNGDNTNDLIATSFGLRYITVYPNIGGDYTTTQLKLILDNQNEYPSGVSTMDVDNDGMVDIIVCNRYNNKISWFRNLGDFTFSGITTLINITNGPNLTSISDIDNDGLSDIVVGLNSNDSVVWLKNNGNGTFLDSQVIYSDNSYDIAKIITKDLDNDGFPEVIIGDNNNHVYWEKNLGNGIFGIKTALANASSGKSFEFEDINNDNFPDYICTSSTYLIKQLNQSGNAFGANQSNNTGVYFGEFKFKDIDHDGLTDLVGSTGNNISSLKRVANGTFQSATTLVSVTPVSYFIADDLNNDTYIDFIVPSYNSTVTKLSAFMGSANSYSEKLISYFNSAVRSVKIADLDNDGENDIISGFNSIVWNKNKGGGNFTSYKKISTGFPSTTTFTYDIEAVDIDNDNDKDIVASTNLSLEIYYNDGNGNFTLGYTTLLPYAAHNIEVADLNGDSLKDIVMTFSLSASGGTITLGWIPNLTGTTFGSLITLGVSAYGYHPYLIICADMDNDNDIDIVTYSNEYSRVHLHTNNGNGVFTKNTVADAFSAVCMAVEDFDNDGDKDIFAAGNYYPGIYLIKNNNGVFDNTKTVIEYKKADALEFADLNGDGLKEIIGTATETPDLCTLYYYLNNGTDFGNQILINSEGPSSLLRSLSLGDLNNDNKPDIVNGFLASGKVTSILNSSTLSIQHSEIKDGFSFYPVPFTEILNWEIPNTLSDIYNINIYNETGKLVYSKKEISSYSIDLNFLPKGIYIVNLQSGFKSYSRKIIKN